MMSETRYTSQNSANRNSRDTSHKYRLKNFSNVTREILDNNKQSFMKFVSTAFSPERKKYYSIISLRYDGETNHHVALYYPEDYPVNIYGYEIVDLKKEKNKFSRIILTQINDKIRGKKLYIETVLGYIGGAILQYINAQEAKEKKMKTQTKIGKKTTSGKCLTSGRKSTSRERFPEGIIPFIDEDFDEDQATDNYFTSRKMSQSDKIKEKLSYEDNVKSSRKSVSEENRNLGEDDSSDGEFGWVNQMKTRKPLFSDGKEENQTLSYLPEEETLPDNNIYRRKIKKNGTETNFTVQNNDNTGVNPMDNNMFCQNLLNGMMIFHDAMFIKNKYVSDNDRVIIENEEIEEENRIVEIIQSDNENQKEEEPAEIKQEIQVLPDETTDETTDVHLHEKNNIPYNENTNNIEEKVENPEISTDIMVQPGEKIEIKNNCMSILDKLERDPTEPPIDRLKYNVLEFTIMELLKQNTDKSHELEFEDLVFNNKSIREMISKDAIGIESVQDNSQFRRTDILSHIDLSEDMTKMKISDFRKIQLFTNILVNELSDLYRLSEKEGTFKIYVDRNDTYHWILYFDPLFFKGDSEISHFLENTKETAKVHLFFEKYLADKNPLYIVIVHPKLKDNEDYKIATDIYHNNPIANTKDILEYLRLELEKPGRLDEPGKSYNSLSFQILLFKLKLTQYPDQDNNKFDLLTKYLRDNLDKTKISKPLNDETDHISHISFLLYENLHNKKTDKEALFQTIFDTTFINLFVPLLNNKNFDSLLVFFRIIPQEWYARLEEKLEIVKFLKTIYSETTDKDKRITVFNLYNKIINYLRLNNIS